MQQETSPHGHIRRNIILNIADAGFFGFGLQLSSFLVVIPLFAGTLTDSTLLIGLMTGAHTIGWQLPQLFTADRVARRRRYLPMVLFMTIHERWPFLMLALACLGLAAGVIDKTALLVLSFIAIWIHSLGGGVTATPWQSMISKILPARIRGTFYGTQSAIANLTGSAGAALGALLLATLPYPVNYAACFGLTGAAMMISLGFLAGTREAEHEPEYKPKRDWRATWRLLSEILRTDANFRWFVIARLLSQIAQVPLLFYALYAVREHNISAAAVAAMVGITTIAQTFASLIAGRLGDLYGHRLVFAVINVLIALSALVALFATDANWFVVVFVLVGGVNAQWTTILAIAPEFSPTVSERPFYIGLMNTAVSPVTLVAPIVGGVLIDVAGFHATFGMTIVTGLVASLVTAVMVSDPQRILRQKEKRLAAMAGD